MCSRRTPARPTLPCMPQGILPTQRVADSLQVFGRCQRRGGPSTTLLLGFANRLLRSGRQVLECYGYRRELFLPRVVLSVRGSFPRSTFDCGGTGARCLVSSLLPDRLLPESACDARRWAVSILICFRRRRRRGRVLFPMSCFLFVLPPLGTR